MADDTFALPGTLSRDELLADLRNEEDLFFQLTGCRINPDTGENNFEFASTIYDDPPSALGDPDTFLKLHAFACAPSDAAACEQAEEDFRAFDGGAVVWFGAIRLVGVATFVVFYRGSDPEFPQGHVPVPADPSLPFHSRGCAARVRSGRSVSRLAVAGSLYPADVPPGVEGQCH